MPRDSPTMRLTSSGDSGRTTIIPQSCSLGKRYFAPASGLGMEELVLLGVQAQRGNGRGLPRLVEVNEGEPALVRVTPLTSSDVLGEDVGQHGHRGASYVHDAGP